MFVFATILLIMHQFNHVYTDVNDTPACKVVDNLMILTITVNKTFYNVSDRIIMQTTTSEGELQQYRSCNYTLNETLKIQCAMWIAGDRSTKATKYKLMAIKEVSKELVWVYSKKTFYKPDDHLYACFKYHSIEDISVVGVFTNSLSIQFRLTPWDAKYAFIWKHELAIRKNGRRIQSKIRDDYYCKRKSCMHEFNNLQPCKNYEIVIKTTFYTHDYYLDKEEVVSAKTECLLSKKQEAATNMQILAVTVGVATTGITLVAVILFIRRKCRKEVKNLEMWGDIDSSDLEIVARVDEDSISFIEPQAKYHQYEEITVESSSSYDNLNDLKFHFVGTTNCVEERIGLYAGRKVEN